MAGSTVSGGAMEVGTATRSSPTAKQSQARAKKSACAPGEHRRRAGLPQTYFFVDFDDLRLDGGRLPVGRVANDPLAHQRDGTIGQQRR